MTRIKESSILEKFEVNFKDNSYNLLNGMIDLRECCKPSEKVSDINF